MDRRDFLKILGIGGAAITVPAVLDVPEPVKPVPPLKGISGEAVTFDEPVPFDNSGADFDIWEILDDPLEQWKFFVTDESRFNPQNCVTEINGKKYPEILHWEFEGLANPLSFKEVGQKAFQSHFAKVPIILRLFLKNEVRAEAEFAHLEAQPDYTRRGTYYIFQGCRDVSITYPHG